MRPATIKKLIELVEESEIEVLEVSSWGRSVKITRKQPSANGFTPQVVNQGIATQPVVVPVQQFQAQVPAASLAEPAAAVAASPQADSNLVEIKAPMVGTFYSSPSPDSPVFVKVGDSVSVGSVVCIVEAMKLMNEIESEVSGKITKVLVENGQPIEFGQPLYLVDITG